MHTFDRYVNIEAASDYTLQREMETIIECIARGQKVCGPGYPDPRYRDIKAIAAEQARREATRRY